MKTHAFIGIALAMSVSAFSQTSPPAAPALTAGAEFKGLRLDWDTVPGAAWYQLEYRAHENGPFVQQGDDFPASTTSTHFSFPLHLFDWSWARYRLAACNSAGCSRSAAISVYALRRDAVGYFKSSQPAAGARFGAGKDLSSDGYNMAVVEPASRGYDEEQGTSSGGYAYVFRRNSNGSWTQRVRLDLGDMVYGQTIELNTAISSSGNTVAVGLPNLVPARGTTEAGAVFVYQYTNGTWSKTNIDKIWETEAMGTSVSLDDSGKILAIGNGDYVNTTDRSYSVVVYQLINGAWTRVQNLSTVTYGAQEICDPHVMSRDGRVIAQRCLDMPNSSRPRRDHIRVFSGNNWTTRTDINLASNVVFDHKGFAIDAAGNTIAVQFSQQPNNVDDGVGYVKVFKLISGLWTETATLRSGDWRGAPYMQLFGNSVSVSGDGQTIAVGDPADNGANSGPRTPPLASGTAQTGAVYAFRLTGGTWKLVDVVKPNYSPNPGVSHVFGESTALSGTGKTLIVAVPGESSSASGIGGNWANTGRASSGAVFMY